MEEKVYEVSLGQLFRIALKHWWIILVAIVLGVAVAFVYVSYFVTPEYTTNALVGVNNLEMTSYQDMVAGHTTAKDSAKIIMGNIVLGKAAQMLNSSSEAAVADKVYSAESLAKMIKATGSDESRYIDVNVTSGNPEEARIVCSYVIKAFCMVLEEEDILSGAEGRIIHDPITPTAPSSPNKTLSAVLGALIGLILSFGTLIVIHFSKDSLESEEWLIETYKEKIPMLAVVPDANGSSHGYGRYTRKYSNHYKNYYATKN